MVKVEKDNVVLSIEDKDLAQYEARGYNKVGATKKVASKDLQKEVNKLAKANEELKASEEKFKESQVALVKENEELKAKIAELEEKVK